MGRYRVARTVLDAHTHRFEILIDDQVLSYERVLNLMQDDFEFVALFDDTLIASPFSAYRWETPAIARHCAGRPFEFVLIDAPYLARRPDLKTFAEYFKQPSIDGVVAFASLGGDTRLVSPTPDGSGSYSDLASFLRQASVEQRRALWRVSSQEVLASLTDRPVWLSTAGGGVAWLHVRVDRSPKYYGYAPYRQRP